MFKYLPVTEPKDLAIFERFTRRCFRAGIAMIVITGILLLAVPSRQMNLFGLQLAFLIIAFVALIATTRPLKFKQDYKRLGFSPHTKPALPFPLSLRYLISSLLLWIAFPAMMFGMSSSKMTALAVGFAYALALIGWSLAFHGLRARNPSPPCCTKCYYPIDPETLPTECPECGKAVSNINHLTRTPIVKRPMLIAWGVPMFIFGIVMFQLALFKPAGMFAVMPRPALLAAAAGNRDAFARIDTDKLSGAERDRLIDGIFKAREDAWSYGTSDQLEWIASLLFAGDLTSKQTDQYLFGNSPLRVIHRVVDGPELVNQISMQLDLPDRRKVPMWYFSDTFPLPESSKDDRTATTPWRALIPLEWTFDQRDRYQQQPDLPGLSLVPTLSISNSSPVEVSARIVVVVGVAASPDLSIVWHADGTYTVSPEPLLHREFKASATIPPLAP